MLNQIPIKLPSTLLTKIYTWFAFYIVAFFVIATLFSIYIETGHKARFWSEIAGDALVLVGTSASEKHEQKGQSSVRQIFDEFANREKMELWLFNLQGEELSGREVPEEISQIVFTISNQSTHETDSKNLIPIQKPVLTRVIEGSSGNKYIIVAKAPGHFVNALFSGFILKRLLIFFLLAGLFSFLIAKHLVTPIRKLKVAVAQLGQGNLGARVNLSNEKRKDELVDLALEFNRMAEKIESLEGIKNQLLSDVSHELRSPLTRLNIALEMIQKQNIQEIKNYTQRIELESRRLDTLIERLLIASREKIVDKSDQPGIVNMGQVLEECVEDANFEARNRHCNVLIVSSENIEIQAKKDLIKSALENVIQNAVHYTKEHTDVEVTTGIIIVDNERFVQIKVKDSGDGIPEELLKRIFHPFFRIDNSRDRKSGGTGLGLAITERIVKFYHGSVKAQNAPEGGLLVEILLPAKQ